MQNRSSVLWKIPRAFVLGALATLAATAAVTAAPDAAAADSRSVLVIAEPATGASSLSAAGLSDVVVHVEGETKGDVTISIENAYTAATVLTRATATLDRSLTVVLPVDPTTRYSSDVAVVVRSSAGDELGRVRLSASVKDSPIVMVLDPKSDVATSLVGERVEFVGPQAYSAPATVKQMMVVHPPLIEGRVRAPEHTAGFQEVSLVLTTDTQLAELTPAAQDALRSWVMLGGRLAIEKTGEGALQSMPDSWKDLPVLVDRRAHAGAGFVYAFSAAESKGATRHLVDEVRAAQESRKKSFVYDPNPSNYQFDQLRRVLDPNESFRPALGAAAVLIILYAIIAGPLLFRRARRRGKPLEILHTLPLASAGAFILILGLGVVTKGIHGRARRLAFLDAESGKTVAPSRTVRAFYANKSSSFDIEAATTGGLPRLVHGGLSGEGEETLAFDAKGARLTNVSFPPWQTAIVVEDGKTDLGGSIDIRGTEIKNGSPYAIRDAFYEYGNQCVYFERIAPGTTVSTKDGRDVPRGCAAGSAYTPRSIAVYQLASYVPHARYEEFSTTWEAVLAEAPQTDVFPEGVNVLIGEIESPKAPMFDTGLYLDKSRALVRVVGEGGL